MVTLKDEILIAVFGALIGAFIGALIALWIDHIKTPNLDITIGDPADDAVNKRRFLILKVENRERSGLLGRFIKGNRPALHCRVMLEFKDPESDKQLFAIQARWVSAAEPVSLTASGQGVFNPTQALAAETETILRDDERPLNVAIKYEGGKDFWGYNNWSYPYNTKRPEWKNASDRIKVVAHLKCDSVVNKEWSFMIANPGKTISDFKIEKLKL